MYCKKQIKILGFGEVVFGLISISILIYLIVEYSIFLTPLPSDIILELKNITFSDITLFTTSISLIFLIAVMDDFRDTMKKIQISEKYWQKN